MKKTHFAFALSLCLCASASFAADRGFTCTENKDSDQLFASGSQSGVTLAAAPDQDDAYSVTVSADGQVVTTMPGGAFENACGVSEFYAQTSDGSTYTYSGENFTGEEALQSGPQQELFGFMKNEPSGLVPLFAVQMITMTCSLN